ncbi:endonuclease/exonuclease/phosphatase family protein [Antrihabitans sp. YC2-6]|uniref:endonuclease/exonuclease/phosphatase family protein n=1 Tax=Antrihabitans sp. YC2-6 TaxID=2799498 RepID=UPI0018F60DC6|nr:endonuclease/exonuclease/phosphatase family protein [Antrihabitans sp. YC2-6]MBJ8344886.1 endonuclease/exonuclease/phosphatase family protein [Antrihabitans sp. YC2-6]
MYRNWGRTAIVVIGWLAVAVGLFGTALHWSNSAYRPFVLLASFAPYVMSAGVLGLLVLLGVRHWPGVVAAGLVVGAALWTQVPAYVANGAGGSGPELTLMQANILFGGGDAEAIVSAVGAHDVDVLTLEELTDEGLAKLEAEGIDRLLPYRFVEAGPGAVGTGIWSRYPLEQGVKYEGFILDQLSARLILPTGRATVFAFHPVPPYPGGPQRWITEMERIREILDAVPADSGPVLVGADFNATRDHSRFRELVDGRFEDAADQSGAGLLATYPADRWWPAVIGIDHVLVAGATASEVVAVTIPGSDHKAVIAKIRLGA